MKEIFCYSLEKSNLNIFIQQLLSAWCGKSVAHKSLEFFPKKKKDMNRDFVNGLSRIFANKSFK